MGTIKRFEDLHAWQSARELTNRIYGLSAAGQFARDFGLRDQLRRAASSVMLNIAEGFDAGSDPKFVQFLGYARRSASETQAGLYTALDQKYISPAEFSDAYKNATICKKQINAMIAYLHKPRAHGAKETSAAYKLTATPGAPIPPPDSYQPDHSDYLDHLDHPDQSDQSDH